ncbi:MAG TPA: hypothetical protein VGM88_00850 [Kofleriaceae bacterium]|jgi:hypothetical protein
MRAVLLVFLTACTINFNDGVHDHPGSGDDSPDASHHHDAAEPDSGVLPDATPNNDGGVGPDSGFLPDAAYDNDGGSFDATCDAAWGNCGGVTDGGIAPDGGVATDGGVAPCDAAWGNCGQPDAP